MKLEHMMRLAEASHPAMDEASELCAALDQRIAGRDRKALLLPGMVADSGLELSWPVAIAGGEVAPCEPWFGGTGQSNESEPTAYLVVFRVWQPKTEDAACASVLVKVGGGGLVYTWRRLRQLLDAFDWSPAPDARGWDRHSELECHRLEINGGLCLDSLSTVLLTVADKLCKALTGGQPPISTFR